MKVCQFYLQGTCKYGNQCRFEHPYQGNFGGFVGSSVNQSYAYNNRFAALGTETKKNSQAATKDFQSFLAGVAEEIRQWEGSKQWPLSTYAPLKEGPSIPGLVDWSPEELRWEAYRAKNNPATYLSALQELTQTAKLMKDSVSHPNQMMKDLLLKIFRKEQLNTTQPSSTFGAAGQGTFGKSTVSSGSSNFSLGHLGGRQQTSGFGGSAVSGQQTSGFGGSAVFGQSPNLFGKTAAQPQTGLFGKPATTSVFSASGSSVFGGPDSSQQTSNLFSRSGTNQQSSSIFGGTGTQQTANVFGGTGSSVYDGSSSIQQPGYVFGGNVSSQQSSGIFTGSGPLTEATQKSFGSAQQQLTLDGSSTFGESSSTNLFSGPTQTGVSGSFGIPSQGSVAFGVSGVQSGTGLFGKPAVSSGTQPGLFGKPAPVKEVDLSLYTPMSELTEEEKQQFTAEKFTIGKIPTRPPPRELCF